jgi:CheY-like chemotaxis protein
MEPELSEATARSACGIADYGLIGDCRTAALVWNNGSIDWLCLPHFSGPSVFASLLDQDQGGCFSIKPDQPFRSARRYVDTTPVLETTFETESGVARLTDFMPIVNAPDALQPKAENRNWLPRAVSEEAVLVVDDEPTVRMLVGDILADLGYHAIEAADAVSGLKVLQSDVKIDLLITDVGLPGGMNGKQMADAARLRRPNLKVLFITGYAENAAISNGHLGPGMHVLSKPFPMDKLAASIRSIIEDS